MIRLISLPISEGRYVSSLFDNISIVRPVRSPISAGRSALREALPELADDRWHINLMQRSPHFFGNMGHDVPDREQAIAFTRAVERLRGAPKDPFAVVERLYLRNLRWSLRREKAPLPCQSHITLTVCGSRDILSLLST